MFSMFKTSPTKDGKVADTTNPTIDGLTNFVSNLGSVKDTASQSCFSRNRALGRHELDSMYRDSWLARKVIDVPTEEMTRAWRQFDTTDIRQSELAAEEQRIQLKAKVAAAIRWARLYGGSALYLGIKGQDPSQPLKLTDIKRSSLSYLQVLDRHRLVGFGDRDCSLDSSNFGLPLFYEVRNGDNSVKIHHSRLVRFDGAALPSDLLQANDCWSDSVLVSLYSVIQNAETASAVIASLLHEAVVDVVKVPGLEQMLSQKDGEQKLHRRFGLAMQLKSLNNTLLLGQGEDYSQKSVAFSGIKDVLCEFMALVAAAADMPVTRLLGQSPAGLNSTGESDLRNFYDMISARQESQLRPQLSRIDEVLQVSLWGHKSKRIDFAFNPLWQMTELEKADLALKQSQIHAADS